MKSILQKNEKCFVCQGEIGTEEHHIFPGNPNRRHSEEDGLKVRLCRDCHWLVHNDAELGHQLMLALKQIGQKKYEEKHTRKEFMERYGRNWL